MKIGDIVTVPVFQNVPVENAIWYRISGFIGEPAEIVCLEFVYMGDFCRVKGLARDMNVRWTQLVKPREFELEYLAMRLFERVGL